MMKPATTSITLPLYARRALRARSYKWVSEWAAKYPRWVETPSRSGPWNSSESPMVNGIMDAMGYSSVAEVDFLAVPQFGKTEMALTLIAFFAHQEPSSFMYVVQTDEEAATLGDDRLKPMFKKTSFLRKLASFSGRDKWTGKLPLVSSWGWIVSGQSVNKLASKPVRFVILDEEEKYPRDFKSKGEASAVRLAMRRMESFHRPKALRMSTLTDDTGTLCRAYLSAAVRFVFVSCCPHCGAEQLMHPKNLLVDDEYKRDPDLIEAEDLGYYKCADCDEKWTIYDRDQSIASGRWVVGNAPWADELEVSPHAGMCMYEYLEKFNSKRVAFWSWRAQRTGQKFSKIIANRIKSKYDPDVMHDYINGDLCQPWRDMSSRRTSDSLRPLRVPEAQGGHKIGLVPLGPEKDGKPQPLVACLLAAVDVQKDWLKYEIRGFGYGLSRPSWGIRCGVVDFDERAENPFEELEKVLWGIEYKDAEGNVYPVRMTAIDSGYHTQYVYDWARRHKNNVRAIKGGSQGMRNPFIASRLDEFPPDRRSGVRKKIPGGLDLWILQVDYYKEILSALLTRRPDDIGAWRFATEYPDSWLDELCSESKNAQGKWVQHAGMRAEAWDVSVYLLALEDMLKVRLWTNPGVVSQQAISRQQQPAEGYRKPRGINPFTRGGGFGGNPYTRSRR